MPRAIANLATACAVRQQNIPDDWQHLSSRQHKNSAVHCGPCSLCSLLFSPNMHNAPSQRTNPSPLSLAQGALLDAMHLMQCILRKFDSATIKNIL
jgi:hypothetical protein